MTIIVTTQEELDAAIERGARGPITVHIARLLANCAVCPIHEAAAELAAYLTKDLT